MFLKSILGLLIILSAHFSSCQIQDVDGIAKRANRLLQFLEQNHLQPREVNNDFAKDLHHTILNSLDTDKEFFFQEDIQSLVVLSDSLDDFILSKELSYLLLLEEKFLARIELASQIVMSFLERKKINLFQEGLPFSENTSFPIDKEGFTKKWEAIVLESLHRKILFSIEDENQLNKDSIQLALNDAILKTKKSYSDYFKRLSATDDYFEILYLNAIAKTFDPHSSYFNSTLRDEFTEELSSERVVFGISYQTNNVGEVEITEILPGSSAWYSEGIHSGDVILSIKSGEKQYLDVSNSSISEFSSFFNDLESNSIVLEIKTARNEVKEVILNKRAVYSDGDVIKTAVLKGEKKVGYISLPDFYTNWTDTSVLGCANDIAKALLKLQKENIDGLILDLRNNGGGSIDEAIDIVGIFINYGPVVIEESSEGEAYTYKDFNRGSIYRGPLIVMVNNASASASEIVAGAMQDYNRGLIVGQKTFGKATGQYIHALDPTREFIFSNLVEEDDSWGYAKVTNIGLYRINKQSLQGVGVLPDILTQSMRPKSASRYEKDYPHFIQLDSIGKKVYFTPKAKLNTAAISTQYKIIEENKIDSISLLIEKMDSILLQLDRENNLKTSYGLLQQRQILRKRITSLKGAVEFDYTPNSFLFNEQVMKMSPFLLDYDKSFLNRLNRDVELNEVYKIMNLYLQFQ